MPHGMLRAQGKCRAASGILEKSASLPSDLNGQMEGPSGIRVGGHWRQFQPKLSILCMRVLLTACQPQVVLCFRA